MRTIELGGVLEYSGSRSPVPHHSMLNSRSAELGALYTAGGIPLLHTCSIDNTPRNEWLTHRALNETISVNDEHKGKIVRLGSMSKQSALMVGLLPRNMIVHRMSLRPSVLSTECPEFSLLVIECLETIWEQAKRECATLWEDMMDAPRVPDEWSLGNTPFTTAQINPTAALPYHRDRGNLAWSPCSMLILRQGTEGGYLHIPQLDLLVPGNHGTIVTFYQDSLWHGVTPIEISSKPRSARVSIVGYVNRLVHKELADIGEDCVNHTAMLTGTRLGQTLREGVVTEALRRQLMGTPVRFEDDD